MELTRIEDRDMDLVVVVLEVESLMHPEEVEEGHLMAD